eukprot:719581-Rhodomonas_salina.1
MAVLIAHSVLTPICSCGWRQARRMVGLGFGGDWLTTKRLFVAVELNDADKQSVVRSMDDFRSSLPESRVGGVLKWVKVS